MVRKNILRKMCCLCVSQQLSNQTAKKESFSALGLTIIAFHETLN